MSFLVLRLRYLVAIPAGALVLLAVVISLQGKSAAQAAIPYSYVGGPTPTVTPTCGPVWRIEYSPNAGNHYNKLAAVDDVGNNHLWAVGWSQDDGAVTLPVAQYWDGSQWTVSATPPITESGYLTAVDARTDDDVWAVGYSFSVMGTQTLTMHWDGTQWSLVPSPNRSHYQFNDYLMGVTAVSANDVWAVGFYEYPQANFYWKTLIMHWDGVSWQAVDSPNGFNSTNNYLISISGTSGNDIWAVGYYSAPGQITPLTMHWDGSSWTIVDVPVTPNYSYYLNSVSAYTSNEVWAVGAYEDDPNQFRAFAIRWDGTGWQRHDPPNPSIYTNIVYDVKTVSPGEAWAVGTYGTGSSGQDAQTLSLHWSGSSWQVVPSSNGSASGNYLNSVTASSNGELWSVGSYTSGGVTYSLTMRYPSDGCVTPTITATPIILPSRTPTPTYTPSCGLEWRVVPSVNTLGYQNFLRNVDTISENDAWAVGSHLEHWDGVSWSLVPNGPDGWGVSGTASNDVWIVNTEQGGSDSSAREQSGMPVRVPPPVATTPPGYRTLISHWDGSQWTRVPSPNPDSFYNFLTGVASITPDDAWAVGYYGNTGQTLALHWDGTAWTVVPSPNAGDGDDTNMLESVYANTSSDVWAAGYYLERPTYRYQYFVMHWDGASWTTSLAPPADPNGYNQLYDISATASHDVWAVGTAIMHWDGSQWTETPNPVPGSELHGVVALAPDNVWVTGSIEDYPVTHRESVILHWDGSQWTRVSNPNPDPYSSTLDGIAANGPDSIWTVGYTGREGGGSIARTLIERYSDPCSSASPTSTPNPNTTTTATATRTPSRTATRTPTSTMTPTMTPTRTSTWTATRTPMASTTPIPSATAVPISSRTATAQSTGTSSAVSPTATSAVATMTSTSCPLLFSDVPEGSTFYAFVRCLACRLIVSGYSDGTFRPNNNVTRGQLSKIVSNSAGFSDPQTAQIFEDVRPGSTFFDYIGRLASRGYISGYPCGGTGEPCNPPDNLPYFRTNNNATRGQITKIVSNAAGFSDPPAGQIFEDVPPGSTFYTYTQRLASRGVMQGYPCRGPGEPCNPPLDRPYFRTFNNATRGQTSKIVANTFFPDCRTPAHKE